MSSDMKRLCEAAAASFTSSTFETLHHDAAEAIVRAVLMELREVSDEGFAAMEEAMKRPRMHVGHKASDDVRGAYIALDAYVDHILDTKGRREAALSDLAKNDADLL